MVLAGAMARRCRPGRAQAGSGQAPPDAARLAACITPPSKPFQHDLAARFSAFQQRVRPLEIGGIDGAEMLRDGGADFPRIDEGGDLVEQHVLLGDVGGSQERAGEHRFPVNYSLFTMTASKSVISSHF